MEMNGQLHAPAALLSMERSLGVHWIRNYVRGWRPEPCGERKIISWLCQESNAYCSVVQPAA